MRAGPPCPAGPLLLLGAAVVTVLVDGPADPGPSLPSTPLDGQFKKVDVEKVPELLEVDVQEGLASGSETSLDRLFKC